MILLDGYETYELCDLQDASGKNKRICTGISLTDEI